MKYYIVDLLISEIAEGYDDYWILLKDKSLLSEQIKKDLIHAWFCNNFFTKKNENISYKIVNSDYINNRFQLKLISSFPIDTLLDRMSNEAQDSITIVRNDKISWEEIKELGFMDINNTQHTLEYTARLSLVKYKYELLG